MQPLSSSHPHHTSSAGPTYARPRRLALACTALALAAVLAACGGGSSDDASTATDGSASETTAPASSDGDAGATTTAVAGAPDLEICDEVTKDDVAAILTDAELTEATRNDAIPAPNCGYAIQIEGGGTSMPAEVVSIVWNDPSYFDGQRELQTDETDLTGLDADAFALDDGGTVVVRGESGTFVLTRGVELTAGGQPASLEQMTAIAELVQGL